MNAIRNTSSSPYRVGPPRRRSYGNPASPSERKTKGKMFKGKATAANIKKNEEAQKPSAINNPKESSGTFKEGNMVLDDGKEKCENTAGGLDREEPVSPNEADHIGSFVSES